VRRIKSTAHNGLAARLFDLRKVELADPRCELAAMACLVPLLLWAAFWNGFPIIYYDTGAYVLEGLGGHFMMERSPVYSLFLRLVGAGTSLWFVVFIQAAATAFVLTQCGRALTPRLSLGVFLLFGAAIVAGTGLPWYAGQIEPDCFAALVVLSIYLLVSHARTLGSVRGVLLVALGGFAAASHPSHLLLAGFLLILIAAASVVAGLTGSRWPGSRLLKPALVCVLGFMLTVGGNFIFTRQFFVSRAGASFVFARMLQDGIVMRLLDDTCPGSGYRLCAYRNSLPPTADGWLWTPNSPFFKLGHFDGTASESERIVRDALMRYPVLQLRTAIGDAATQFFRFGTGDQIEPQEWVLYPVLARYIPRQMSAYLAARQQRGAIDFRLIGKLDIAVGILSLGVLAFMLAWSIQAGYCQVSAFLGFVLAALIGNAVICGVLSGPHDRYQSRLMWITPFSLLLATASQRRGSRMERKPADSCSEIQHGAIR